MNHIAITLPSYLPSHRFVYGIERKEIASVRRNYTPFFSISRRKPRRKWLWPREARSKVRRKHLDETVLTIRTHNSSPIIRLVNGRSTKLKAVLRWKCLSYLLRLRRLLYPVTRSRARMILSRTTPIRFTDRISPKTFTLCCERFFYLLSNP